MQWAFLALFTALTANVQARPLALSLWGAVSLQSRGVLEMAVLIVHGLSFCPDRLLGCFLQIVTRLLSSSCPAVHWYAAYLWQGAAPSSGRRRWLLAYALIYIVVGTILHVNFLPWT
jgi:hypothetical protein